MQLKPARKNNKPDRSIPMTRSLGRKSDIRSLVVSFSLGKLYSAILHGVSKGVAAILHGGSGGGLPHCMGAAGGWLPYSRGAAGRWLQYSMGAAGGGGGGGSRTSCGQKGEAA